MTKGVRLDKWLWAARFFKTRPLAQKAIEGGKVRVDGARSKPGKHLQVGQNLEIRLGVEVYHVVVLALSEKRGPAPMARTLYQETEESSKAREQASIDRKASAASEPRFESGKPDKYQRRRIQKLKQKNRDY